MTELNKKVEVAPLEGHHRPSDMNRQFCDAMRAEIKQSPQMRAGDNAWAQTIDALLEDLDDVPKDVQAKVGVKILRLTYLFNASQMSAAALERRNAVLMQRNGELEREILIDAGTGIPNKTFFFNELGLAITAVQQGIEAANDNVVPQRAALIIDVGGLTSVNTKLGQDAGDVAIWAGAHLLDGIARKGEGPSLVSRTDPNEQEDSTARVGGDEYGMVLIDGSGRDDFAGGAQERLEGQLAGACFEYDGQLYPLMFYVAVVEIDGTQDANAVFKAAGQKLYDAKAEAKHDRHAVDLTPVDPADVTGPIVMQPIRLANGSFAPQEQTPHKVARGFRFSKHEEPTREPRQIQPKPSDRRATAPGAPRV